VALEYLARDLRFGLAPRTTFRIREINSPLFAIAGPLNRMIPRLLATDASPGNRIRMKAVEGGRGRSGLEIAASRLIAAGCFYQRDRGRDRIRDRM